MNNKTYNKLLSVEYTKFNLMTAAIYLTAYELLKSSIIDEVEKFYIGVEADGETKMLEEYKLEVILLDASIFVSSCKWLEKMGALSIDDIKDLLDIREHRHRIAHQLPDLLIDDEVNINTKYLFKMQSLLTKIDSWWIKEVELSTNPDYANQDMEKLEVKSGPMLILNHLISILKAGDKMRKNIQ